MSFFKSLLVFIYISSIPLAYAHEFWLEPHAYQLETGGNIIADARVGQFFRGNAQYYLPKFFKQFEIIDNKGRRAVQSRVGDLPAVNEPMTQAGLATLAYVSKPSRVTYEDMDKFSTFVEKHDLGWVLQRHVDRKLPEKEINEAYVRHSKALVQVGAVKSADSDQRLGHLFEWVLAVNPYAVEQNNLSAVLYWQDAPLSGATVRVFFDGGDKKDAITETILITDAQGRIEFDASLLGEYLLNAVQMVEPSAALKKSHNAMWLSHWASLTFGQAQ